MYLTEREAETKICPHITYCINERDVIAEGRSPVMQHGNCVAHACMAWRWAGGLPSTEKGYCGLSGRPGPHEQR